MAHQLTIAVIALLITFSGLRAQEYGDPVSRVQTPGQLSAFDKSDTTRFFFTTPDRFELRLLMVAPELQCFLANHARQELRVKYTTFERADTDGKPIRTLVATEILSLKNGDNLKDWPEKEAADSSFAARNHENLALYLKHPENVR